MTTHYEGYQEARASVANMNRAELLDLLDDLFGRDNLPIGASDDQVRREAYRQLDQEWRTPEGDQKIKDVDALAKAILSVDRSVRKNPLTKTINGN